MLMLCDERASEIDVPHVGSLFIQLNNTLGPPILIQPSCYILRGDPSGRTCPISFFCHSISEVQASEKRWTKIIPVWIMSFSKTQLSLYWVLVHWGLTEIKNVCKLMYWYIEIQLLVFSGLIFRLMSQGCIVWQGYLYMMRANLMELF